MGLVLLIVGAGGVFYELQLSLNTIWEVTPNPASPLRNFITQRLISFSLIPVTGFLLLVSFIVSAGLAAFATLLQNLLPGLPLLLRIGEFCLSLAVITVLFAMLFRILPDVEITWRDVWFGSFITAVLFTLGKLAIGLYLGRSRIATAYGAAASLVILLAWIYYSAQIFFLGAEFTQVYANRYGSRIKPRRGAIPVTEEMRAEQGIPHTERSEPPSGKPPRPSLPPRGEGMEVPRSRAAGNGWTEAPRKEERRPAAEDGESADGYAALSHNCRLRSVTAGLLAGFIAGLLLACRPKHRHSPARSSRAAS